MHVLNNITTSDSLNFVGDCGGGKDSGTPSSYCAVSLLCVEAKILDRILLEILTDVVEELNLFPEELFHFRRDR